MNNECIMKPGDHIPAEVLSIITPKQHQIFQEYLKSCGYRVSDSLGDFSCWKEHFLRNKDASWVQYLNVGTGDLINGRVPLTFSKLGRGLAYREIMRAIAEFVIKNSGSRYTNGWIITFPREHRREVAEWIKSNAPEPDFTYEIGGSGHQFYYGSIPRYIIKFEDIFPLEQPIDNAPMLSTKGIDLLRTNQWTIQIKTNAEALAVVDYVATEIFPSIDKQKVLLDFMPSIGTTTYLYLAYVDGRFEWSSTRDPNLPLIKFKFGVIVSGCDISCVIEVNERDKQSVKQEIDHLQKQLDRAKLRLAELEGCVCAS